VGWLMETLFDSGYSGTRVSIPGEFGLDLSSWSVHMIVLQLVEKVFYYVLHTVCMADFRLSRR
jgi:hypothetical protein